MHLALVSLLGDRTVRPPLPAPPRARKRRPRPPRLEKRYAPGNGPVVFGTVRPLRVDVRWNSDTRALIVEAGENASWCEIGDLAERMLLTLACAHRQGRLIDVLREIFDGVRLAVAQQDDWYRCGKYLLYRPAWQQVDMS